MNKFNFITRKLSLQYQARALGMAGLVLVMNSCVSESSFMQAGNTAVVVNTPANTNISTNAPPGAPVNPISPAKTVCDPFTNNPGQLGADLTLGIVGSINYLTDSMPRYSKVSDYQNFGARVDATLFLDQVYVPTRAFSLGFATQAGQLITNADANSLYEYFSLHLESQAQLGASDPSGNYQFALLADDGAVLQIDDGSGFKKWVDDDGTHATQMRCSSEPLNLSGGSRIPLKIDYYQGPRYHIALTLLWRPWPRAGGADPECTQGASSTRYFDSTKIPSAPTAVFQGMLNRGWKVMSKENFALPTYISSNPCQQPTPPKTFIVASSPNSSISNQTTASFSFNSNIQTATFECSMDGSVRAGCTSPQAFSALGDGSHTFSVWAKTAGSTGQAGQSDPTGATDQWIVDTRPPTISGYSTATTATTLSVQWTTSKPTTTALNWGKDASVSNTAFGNANFSTVHGVTVTGLTADTFYLFTMGGLDQAGNAVAASRFGTSTQSP